MKVSVIGGGSTYSPELVNGFLDSIQSFPLDELWLMDIDAKRLEIVGNFARRMAAARQMPFEIHLTTNQKEAIAGANYVITQLRVGQNPARREDEYLGRRHGLVGQETTGIGGLAKALRTIPVILDIAQDIKRLAPGALLANFTNPAGLVTEALRRYEPDVLSVGVCNVGITTKMNMLQVLDEKLGIKFDPQVTVLNTIGLNHLTWHRGFTVDGEEMWQTIFSDYLDTLRAEPEADFDPRTIEVLGMIPNYYLHYYYDTDRVIADQEKWPPSRAEQVMEIEKALLQQYADPTLRTLPEDLMKRGGAYYSTLATQLLNDHYNDLGHIHVVNVPSQGAVPGIPPDWILELPCQVDARGIHPLPAEPLPAVSYGLVSQVKMAELLTVEAAVHGNRQALYQALLTHPLGPQAHQVQAVMDDLLKTNRSFLPNFD